MLQDIDLAIGEIEQSEVDAVIQRIVNAARQLPGKFIGGGDWRFHSWGIRNMSHAYIECAIRNKPVKGILDARSNQRHILMIVRWAPLQYGTASLSTNPMAEL